MSEIVVRSTDTKQDLLRKATLAAILGTLQSTLTDFRYVRKVWKNNTEEERLLGVSMTGIMDHPLLSDPDNPDLPALLEEIRNVVIETNKAWADRLGIPQSTATTCVKPSGTVSQLVDSASGIHPRYSPYYIRRVRADVKDPLAQLMMDEGVPHELSHDNPNVVVFSFPIKAPDTSVTTSDVGAMDQLRLWKIFQEHWCEHKPSITVYYTDNDFLEVAQWLYNNFDDVSGVSFLPYSGHTYKQAPYEEISEEEYNRLSEEFVKNIAWDMLSQYELDDATEGSQELACVSGACEL